VGTWRSGLHSHQYLENCIDRCGLVDFDMARGEVGELHRQRVRVSDVGLCIR
jgi:hypothetical protein